MRGGFLWRHKTALFNEWWIFAVLKNPRGTLSQRTKIEEVLPRDAQRGARFYEFDTANTTFL